MSAAPASHARAGTRAASGSSVEQAGAERLPATDTLWRDVYHVVAPLPDAGGAQVWRANRTDTAEEILLRVATGAKDDAHSAALTRLCAVDLAHLQRVREVHFVGAHRIEACAPVRGVPLDVWRAERPKVDAATVESVVRQLAEALGVLHATGLVHLGLRPSAVFVREEKGGLHCTLGGLETVTFFDATKPIPAAVDPLYAPPEAAALECHEPGATLCAWDWWSLGRVAQELILGHPVINDVPGADATQPVAARAEELLLERSAKGVRAGAVEAMHGLEPRLELLLRGLLASAPETRWSGDALDRWVKQLPVKEAYSTIRVEKKFRWRGRLWTVADAAKELQSAERWAEAAAHIFEPGKAGTLAHFVARAPEQKTVAPQLAELRKLVEAEPLAALPPEAAREIVASIALLLLAGTHLIWRGRRLDGESLAALLAEAPEQPERLALVRAFTHRNVTTQIERHDFGASRSLAQVGRCAADAEAMIRRNGWLKGPDDEAAARIFRLALTPAAALLTARERLQRDFACSSLPVVEKIFKVAKLAHVELVVLAWVEPVAAASGFVTHADWQAKQLLQLRERSQAIVTALFWARLGRARAAGPALFGPWLAVLAGWIVAGVALAFVMPGWKALAVAAAPLLAILIARVIFTLAPAAALRRFAPAARSWGWRDGIARCEAEAHLAGGGLAATGLERALAEINAEIVKLTVLTPPPAPVVAPPVFAGTRAAGVASWVLIGAVVLVAGWRIKVQTPTLENFQATWFPGSVAPKEANREAEIAAKLEASAGKVESESAISDVKVSWPYRPTDDFHSLTPIETIEPTKTQSAYALQRGRAIVAPYRPESITSFAIFEVPVDGKIGVMIFDGAHGTLAVMKVFVLTYRPPAREWVEIAGKRGVVIPE